MVSKVFKFECIHYFLLPLEVQQKKKKIRQPIKTHMPLDLILGRIHRLGTPLTPSPLLSATPPLQSAIARRRSAARPGWPLRSLGLPSKMLA
jgi:hypothetical protein